jgi:ribosome-binding protein aMBF1 (putative translation factor)
MTRRTKTGFDKFFDQQMASPSFAKAYGESRSEIDAVDQLVRRLDEARLELGVSKAELARAISAKPEIVRRLFTTESPNPTLGTVVRLANALGYKLELVRRSAAPAKSQKKAKPTRTHHARAKAA